jgi:hypothetical protein
MFCHQCGVSNPADASFCGACGTRVAVPLTQTSAVASPPEGYSAAPNIELPQTHARVVYGAQTGEGANRGPRPRGVTILAVLAFVTMIPTVAIGMAVFSIAAGASAEGAIPQMRLLMRFFPVLALGEQEMVSQASAVATTMFLIAAICAALSYGLWKTRKWGRILAIVCGVLLTLHAAAMILTSSGIFLWHLFALGINIWIITYLLKPRVKQAFRV